MGTNLRAFDPATDGDIDLLRALYTATRDQPFPRSRVEEILRRTVSLQFRALIADDGRAYARTFHQPWFPDGLFGVHVLVHPAVRRRGIGARLLSEITGIGRSLGANAQIGFVADGCPEGMDFIQRHGFTVERHMAASSLDPATIDRSLLTVPPPPGIAITTLAELGANDVNRRQVWEITERTAEDFPNERRRPRSYQEFREQSLDSPTFRAAGCFIALDGDAWAGIAFVGYNEARSALYHHMTGVERSYRGRGIATALKRATIAYALEIGASVLETNNDSSNVPMLAINNAFGYVQQPGNTDVYRTLASSSA
ncbi:MAG TPA: GNAT family N-acetyltransferase [Micromonosporaceae bacterium]|jgi:GNAT superfamily N-acetyltransferase